MPQLSASGERPHVVFGLDLPPHFQALTNRRGIALGHRGEHRRMIDGRLSERDVQIDGGDRFRVRNPDLANADAGGTKPVQRLFKPAADVVVQHVAEVRAQDGESKR